MSVLRTVVCGTTFGQFYLAALARLPGQFEIAGVLAAGGARSVDCAARHGVPLYRDVDELPDDVDLACVVVRSGVLGGAGTELALRLLRRGIHVVQEQPVHHEDLAACLREARAHGVRYRLGDLYPRLPEVRRFTEAARAARTRQPITYVDAACASQVAFPLLHILGEALGTTRPWALDAVDHGEEAPFAALTGTIGGAPLTLRVHNQVDPDDPDNHLPLLHQVTIGTAGGRLTLTDPHGPVLWSPRLHIPRSVRDRFDFDADDTRHLGDPATTLLDPAAPADLRRQLSEVWPTAIGEDLCAVHAAIVPGTRPVRGPDQYHLTLARMWQDLTKATGYPTLRPGQSHEPLSAQELTPLSDLLAHAGAEADRRVGQVGRPLADAFVRRLDRAVLGSMLGALQDLGVLRDPGRPYTDTEILHTAGVAPRHHGLVRRWLRVLAERETVSRDGALLRGAAPVDPSDIARDWDAAAALWAEGLGGPEFIAYLRRNAECLPRLMRDEQQAALLLFPQGRTDLADAVYRDTVTARWLNTAVATAVRSLAAAHTPQRPLRVVEIGAGTGATTAAVTAALTAGGSARPCVDYLFTDVSPFFVTAAEARHTAYPWMRHGLYDVDRAPADQAMVTGGADLVIAAGVLNNARDTDASLRHLTDLLAPGGRLLLTEPVREHLEILASQAFMMTPPQDIRRETGSTFLTRRQWLDALTRAGLAEAVTAPAEDHPLAPLGQRLLAAHLR
ncbi:Gfo/Idh/MocA family oxidoreductase [Streptomyces sp. NPDC050560]|uniref:Gfo/Idh/MocA family oxidoreductase n=1 Tax=Streptomyces sp. NPDC050560 TaxID=3365630 RepID=UPI00378CBC62